MEPLATRELVKRATAIVEGTVTEQRVVQLRGRLWTDSRVRLTTVHKGALVRGGLLTVRTLGGETEHVGTRVAGAARLTPGERVLLFARAVDEHHVVVGMCQGKYTIYRDGQGVERVRRDLSGASFAQLNRAGRMVITPSVREVSAPDIELSRLRALVRNNAASADGGGR